MLRCTQGYIVPNADTNATYLTNNGVNSAYIGGLSPVNTDGVDKPYYLDLDSDNNNIFDIIESGQGLNADVNGSTTDPVGINGLANPAETLDDYSDVNGLTHDGTIFTLSDTDNDTADNGSNANPTAIDFDYRDVNIIDAVNDVNNSVPGTGGTAIADVSSNDTLNGVPFTLGTEVNITAVTDTTPYLSVDVATGAATVPANTPAGTPTQRHIRFVKTSILQTVLMQM